MYTNKNNMKNRTQKKVSRHDTEHSRAKSSLLPRITGWRIRLFLPLFLLRFWWPNLLCLWHASFYLSFIRVDSQARTRDGKQFYTYTINLKALKIIAFTTLHPCMQCHYLYYTITFRSNYATTYWWLMTLPLLSSPSSNCFMFFSTQHFAESSIWLKDNNLFLENVLH